MRSVSVVLPASMWAAMPMFRVRSSGKFRSGEFGFFALAGDCFSRVAVAITLPAEMSKGAVCLRHFMSVVALLDRVALARSGVFQFSRQRLGHRHAAAIVGVLDNPAHRERNLPRGRDFHRHLIGGAADSA